MSSWLKLCAAFADAITPASPQSNYPTLLPNQPAPHLRVYPRETVVAETTGSYCGARNAQHALQGLLRLAVLAERFEFDGPVLIEAITATFERRGTPLLPASLSAAFATDPAK
jgi:hypothetical protein